MAAVYWNFKQQPTWRKRWSTIHSPRSFTGHTSHHFHATCLQEASIIHALELLLRVQYPGHEPITCWSWGWKIKARRAGTVPTHWSLTYRSMRAIKMLNKCLNLRENNALGYDCQTCRGTFRGWGKESRKYGTWKGWIRSCNFKITGELWLFLRANMSRCS